MSSLIYLRGAIPKYWKKIEKLKLDGKVAIYFTGCNLDELICMIKDEQQFVKCRQILQFSRRLCSNNILLDDNWRHMQRSVADYLQITPPDVQFDTARIASFICNARNYEEVRKDENFLRLRNHIEEFKQDWLESAAETCNGIKTILNVRKPRDPKHRLVKSLSEDPALGLIKQKLWEACKIHHRVPDYANRLDYDTAYNRIHAVRYFIDIQRAYYDRSLKEGTKPQRGDYFDLEYAIYLSFMDYFVTHDIHRLKSLYNSASREIGQAVIVREDVSKLEYLPARAPDRHKFKQIPFRVVRTQ